MVLIRKQWKDIDIIVMLFKVEKYLYIGLILLSGDKTINRKFKCC